MGFRNGSVDGHLLEGYLGIFDHLDARIRQPFDVVLAHLALEETLSVTHPVKTEMADIGLGGHERHRDAIANLSPPQFCIEDKGELVGRSEA